MNIEESLEGFECQWWWMGRPRWGKLDMASTMFKFFLNICRFAQMLV
jgi:hypothetical protein